MIAKASVEGETLVYKIATADQWAEAVACGRFTGSPDDLRDGFIHLSSRAQLTGTANRYFSGLRGLVVAAFRVVDLEGHLRWEPSRGGDLFPHYYGALPARGACWVRPLPLDDVGRPCVDETLLAR